MRNRITRRTWLAGAAAAGTAADVPETLRLPHKVRLALLGLEGHTGEVLGPLKQVPDVELVALWDPDPRALAAARRHPLMARARQYREYRELLEREELDMAAIGGINGTRSEIILACVGRKLHVVAEKPIAIERAALDRIRQQVAAAGVRLTMLLPMRFGGTYRTMKEMVTAGEIGDVAQIGAQKSYKLGERPQWMRRRASFGGTIPYIGVHMVDLMRFTSGRELVETVSFQSRIGFPEMAEMENTTATLFRLDNGGTAALHMDYLRPETAPTHGDDRLRLAGTRGVIEYQEATGLTLVTRNSKLRVISEVAQTRSLFLDFLNSVYLGGKPGLELSDIFRVNEIVLAARDAAEQHRLLRI